MAPRPAAPHPSGHAPGASFTPAAAACAAPPRPPRAPPQRPAPPQSPALRRPAFGSYIPPCTGFPPLPGLLTTDEFRRLIAGICYKFLYLAAGAGVAGALQQAAWNLTSTRQVRCGGPT